MAMGLDELPNEVIYQVLLCLPPQSIPILQQVSQHFNDLSQPLLWRHHCATRFRYWSPERRINEKFSEPVEKVDWKRLFIERHDINRITTQNINSILASQVGRIQKAEKITCYGYDVKDTLLRHVEVAHDAEDMLARRFHSKAVLGTLHRAMAAREWAKVEESGGQLLVPVERALTAFDMFVMHGRTGDFDEVSARLDELAEQIRGSGSFADRTPRQQIIRIAQYLRERNLTGLSGDGHYHDPQNSFIGMALKDKNHPSLPLVSVVIFCSVANRLGLDAHPCSFPFHVHAIIKPPLGRTLDGQISKEETSTCMYMDPWRSSQEVDVQDLRTQLLSMGANPSDLLYLGVASVADMVRRCAKNIINSVQALPGPDNESTSLFSSEESESALYAAAWALTLLPEGSPAQVALQRARYSHFVVRRAQLQTPMDVGLVEEHFLPRLENTEQHPQLCKIINEIRMEDSKAKQVKARVSREQRNIPFKVGQIFRHKRYHYRAVITGWDVECEAKEDWMQQMGVRALPRGQHQSFYHVL